MTIEVGGQHFDRLCCGECGIVFYAPTTWVGARRDDGENKGGFYCPNGHCRVWRESTLDKVRRERDRAVQEQARLSDALAAQRRATEKAEREAKRVKKRAVAALCPCCNRHFTQLDRHMKSKHPELVPLPDHKIVTLRSEKARA